MLLIIEQGQKMIIFVLVFTIRVVVTLKKNDFVMFKPGIPYNDLPLLPPSVELESKAILKKTIIASRALSELKGAITNLPNPTLFIDTINLQEAQASSAIENIVTTQDELFKSYLADKAVKNSIVKEVLHYKEALWMAWDQLDKKPLLTTNLFVNIVQEIKENNSGIRNVPGTTLKNPLTGKIVYTPPEGEKIIRDKLKNLEDFIHNNKDGIDPLVKMAVIHYQFEAIHPFFDGNGRTGRILLLLYLKLAGLLNNPSLYLSKYIIENKDEYYFNLREVTEKNDWQGWILYMLDMIEKTALFGRRQISSIELLMAEMGSEIQKKLPKVYTKDLLEVLFKLPYTKRSQLLKVGLGNLKTVGNYLRVLEGAGFLRSEKIGKEKLYVNFRLLKVLSK
jgi:Fic family protein